MKTYEDVREEIEKYYDSIPRENSKILENQIADMLTGSGVMYRIFSRIKSKESVCGKMRNKAETKYLPLGEKMQDLIGIRVVLYFADDIDICIRMLKQKFKNVGHEHDNPDPETFRPIRINYVFAIPKELGFLDPEQQQKCLIDRTFEVQIRTILSEGWHEVEHDLRYKHQNDWKGQMDLSRELNGVLATLELCDNALIGLCDKLAMEKLERNSWEAMLRNHLRIRFMEQPISEDVSRILSENKGLALKILKSNRGNIIDLLSKTRLPRTYDNVVYLINLDEVNDKTIEELTPDLVKNKYRNYGCT